MHLRLALLVLALAACADAEENRMDVGNHVDATLNELEPEIKALPIGATPAVGITGEWRVAGVNRKVVDLDWAMTASIDSRTIRISSQCVWFDRRYRLDKMQLGDPPPGAEPSEPEPMCARGLLPIEQEADRALQEAEWAYRLPDRSLVLDGPGGSITLFTQ